MGFPERLLFEGEEPVLVLHPHWWFFAGPVALLTSALGAAVVLAANDVTQFAQLAAACVALAAVAWVVGRYVRWTNTHLVLTTDRIIFRTGVVRKHGLELPLTRVQSVRCRQSIGDRLRRSGDLFVEAADRVERRFQCVPHPKQVQQEIYHQANLIERA